MKDLWVFWITILMEVDILWINNRWKYSCYENYFNQNWICLQSEKNRRNQQTLIDIKNHNNKNTTTTKTNLQKISNNIKQKYYKEKWWKSKNKCISRNIKFGSFTIIFQK
jgi:hypothetical protein